MNKLLQQLLLHWFLFLPIQLLKAFSFERRRCERARVKFTIILWAAFLRFMMNILLFSAERTPYINVGRTFKFCSLVELGGSFVVETKSHLFVLNALCRRVCTSCQRVGEIDPSTGVNFTNILRAAFTRSDPKSAIKLLNLTVFFALLGSVRVKAAHRMLVKLALAEVDNQRLLRTKSEKVLNVSWSYTSPLIKFWLNWNASG